MVKTGIFTKRGVERKQYEIVEAEAEIVKTIFDLFTESGYGGIRIAKYLNEKGYKTHKGLDWSYSTINNMLKNPVYTGYLCFHKTTVPIGGGKRKKVKDKEKWIYSKEKIPGLQIISEEQFEKAQKIKQARTNKNKQNEELNKEYFKYQTKGDMLFTGYIICGGCGAKLLTRSSKRKMKYEDGSTGYAKYNYYACTNNSCGRECNCKKKSHKSNTIEEPVLNEIYKYFDVLEKQDLSENIRKIYNDTKEIEQKQIKEIEKQIKECKNKEKLLKEEIINVITGKSTFSRELLTETIKENNKKMEEFKIKKIQLENLKRQKEIDFEQTIREKNMIPEWKEVFKNINIERKKIILSQIIKKIIVYDEKIDIHLKISFSEFLDTVKKIDLEMITVGDLKNFENLINRGTCKPYTNLGTFRQKIWNSSL